MTVSEREERIRVHITISPSSPAYLLLKAAKTPAERRTTATSLLQSAAAAMVAGCTGTITLAATAAMSKSENPHKPAIEKQASEIARVTDYSVANQTALEALFDDM